MRSTKRVAEEYYAPAIQSLKPDSRRQRAAYSKMISRRRVALSTISSVGMMMQPRSGAPRNAGSVRTEARQLGGKSRRRFIIQRIVRGKHNAGFGRIGEDEADLRLTRQRQISGGEVLIGIDRALDGADQPRLFDDVAILNAVQISREQAILLVQRVIGPRRRLHDDDAASEVGLGIEHIDDPIDEAAQKIAAAELHDALGIAFSIGM